MKNSLILIGALTSKPYAFTARSWELKSIETFDIFESLGSNIRIDIRGSEIMRILPVNNQFVNEEWISDKTRFAYDGLKKWRHIHPMVRFYNFFLTVSWEFTLALLKTSLTNTDEYKKIYINTGNYVDLETSFAIQSLANLSPNIVLNNNYTVNGDKQNYILPYKTIDNVIGKKVFILVGINLRLENPILNIRFKKLSQNNNILIGYIGAKHDYNINLHHLGNNILILKKILEGKHLFATLINSFTKFEIKKKMTNTFKNNVSVIFGYDFSIQYSKTTLISALENTSNNFFKFEFFQLLESFGKINNIELGAFSNKNFIKNDVDQKHSNVYYFIGTEMIIEKPNKNDIVIFQGHHCDRLLNYIDVILPSTTWLEKSGLYINLFGNIQKTKVVNEKSPTLARPDWAIIRLFSMLISKDIKFNNVTEISNNLNKLTPNVTNSINKYIIENKYKIDFKINNFTKSFINLYSVPFKSNIFNYYQSTSVERSSKVMTDCSKILHKDRNNFLK